MAPGQVAYLSGLVTAPPVHLAVTRSLEVLTAILDDIAAEHRVPPSRITTDRGTLEWFDQTIDAIAADSDPVPFAVSRGRKDGASRPVPERIACPGGGIGSTLFGRFYRFRGRIGRREEEGMSEERGRWVCEVCGKEAIGVQSLG